MVNVKDEDVQRDLELLRDWANKQPHLPKNIEDRILRRFLHSCYYSVERTKSCIESFFTIRANAPEILNKRDPLSEDMQKALKIVNLAHVKHPGNTNVWIWQLNDPGLEKYDYLEDARIFFLSIDAWMLDDDNLEEKDVAIMDVKDITLKFITKFNISVAKKITHYQEDAMPIRLREIHVVNAPPFIDKLFGLMKPFMKQEYCDMIHFHAPNSDTLYKYLSKEHLPNDYGGKAGNMEDLMKDTMELILRHREFFLDDRLWKSDENKRQKNSKREAHDNVMDGSFRTLSFD